MLRLLGILFPVTATALATSTRGMMTALDADVKAYNKFVSMAVDLSSGHLNDDGLLTFVRSSRDIDNNCKRNFMYQNVLSTASGEKQNRLVASLPPVELPDDVVLRLPSPSGNHVAIFRKDKLDTDKQVIEIWTRYGRSLTRKIVLNPQQHGSVITDSGGFGKPTWNEQETCIVYVAERKSLKTSSFFDKPADSGALRGAQNTLGVGKQEQWGEKYHKMAPLLDIYILNVETGRIGKVENVPGVDDDSLMTSFTLGQPVFAPSGHAIAYTAWDAGAGGQMPRRLGLIYCQQRPSQIYASDVSRLVCALATPDESIVPPDNDCVNLTPNDRIARSPRFALRGTTEGNNAMVYLASKDGFDTHAGCVALRSMVLSETLEASEVTTIINEIRDHRHSPASWGEVAGVKFPGLFLLELPDRPFTMDNKLLVTTQWGCISKVIEISLEKNEKIPVRVMNCGPEDACQQLIAVRPGFGAVLCCKRYDMATSLHFLGERSGEPEKLSVLMAISGSAFSDVAPTAEAGYTCSVRTLDHPPRIEGVVDLPLQNVLLLPKHVSKPPLLTVVHGGPHSVSSTTFVPSYAYLCQSGFAILMVNYRGSTGYGQDGVESLPARIGNLDVEDVIASTRDVVSSGLVDDIRVGICGGSHGGFLVGHCTGQYPSLFKAAAMRNPVVNVPTMTTATDIPDWCYVEALGVSSYDWRSYSPATSDDLQKMHGMSPVRYIGSVKSPTLVALGLSDLRVPPSQGKEWYHTLRSRGVPTKLLTYDSDDHAIDTTQSEADHWINIKRWFDEFIC